MPNLNNTNLLNKVKGCLYGGAIGDALGAPAEWHLPGEIRERYGTITDFVENWDGPSDIGKGDGRYTDDSHMVQLLSRAYIEHGDHLDAFEFAKRIVPLIAQKPHWVPEFGRQMPLVERLFYPEKWLYLRLCLANADPRQGGVGNMVNCGAAMYAAPVGIVNAGDPSGAYREAIDIFSAHQQSYGLEAAGVMAACVAEAFNPESTVGSIVDIALAHAKEGTRAAIAAIVDCANQFTDWRTSIGPFRETIRPFDGSAEVNAKNFTRTNNWRPSREHSIEELPIALGFLVVTSGDFEESLFGSVNYGRDNDTIAGMAGAIAGALHGARAIRTRWIEQINRANRIDLTPLAQELAGLTYKLQQRRLSEVQRHNELFSTLLNHE